jgi:small subunit ribosomal protein S16
MAARIRLARHGGKKHAFYRIVVTDSNSPRDGRFIEQVGTYDPNIDPARVKIQQEKLEKWLARGAKPTETVAQLLKRARRASAAAPAPA